MQAHEWSNGDISPEITFTADDGRKFGKKFSMNLKVNTAPVLEYAGIGKTTESGEDYYVLIFCAKDMGTMIGGQSVHKDINTMNVTAGGVSRPPIALSVTGSDFATGGDLLAAGAVQKLESTDPELPTGNGLLRLKTDVKVGGPETEYSVSIKDSQGLSSAVISAKTKKNKLSDVQLFDGFTPIPDPADSTSAGATDGNPKVFAGMSGKILTAKAAPDGARITGKVEKQNSDGTWTETHTVSGTTPVTVNLPALGTGENEALYKISLKAQLSGYDDSDSKDFFVKLVRQEVPVLKLVQNFNQNHDLTLHSISAGTQAYVTKDIIPDALTYSTNPLVIYNMGNGQCKLDLSASLGTTVKYKLDSTSSTPTPTAIIITVPIGAHTLEVWAVKGTIEGPHTTVRIKVVNAVSNYTELKNIVQNAPEKGSGDGQYNYNNFINIKIGSAAELTADSEIAVTGGKKLMLSSSVASTVRTINANNSGRIFKISGPGTLLTLWDLQLTGGDAVDGKGGAVCVEAGGDLWLKGKTVITPSTESDINTKGKNDVYLAIGSLINLDGILTGATPIVARITPAQYRDGEAVLGSNIAGGTPPNYKKFRVTQPDDGFLWTIKNDGTLQAIPTTINGGSGAWKRLKEAVEKLPEGSVITINGEIAATSDPGNSGVIDIGKNITIQGKTGAGSDILNANSSGSYYAPSPKHQIFKVQGGRKLTLKNLTLKDGKASTGIGGGAIYLLSGSEAELEGCIIEACKADKGGAIGCNKSSTVKLTNTIIKNCTAHTGGNAGTGGAIYAEGATVTMTGCTLTGNKADKGGGAIYAQKHTSSPYTPSNVTIEGGTIGGTGEGEANKTIGSSGIGGGIYIEANTTVTLQNDAQIIGNEAEYGGGVYLLGSESTLKIKGDAIVDTNNDVYLNYGSGQAKITVASSLTPPSGIAARITVADDKYHPTTQVLTAGSGVNLANETYKFTVTPKGSEEWEIGSDGKLKNVKVVNGGTENAWNQLKTAVQSAVNGDVITIRGTVKATNASGNSGEIEINNKNITIKGAKGIIAVLDANSTGGDKPSATHRIFNIKGTSKVHLENLTLKNGNETQESSATASGGGGIRMESTAELWLIGVTIEGCTSKGNGGGLRLAFINSEVSGKLTMKNSKIINNTVKDDGYADASSGGGIGLANRPYTAVIEDCEISGNKVDVSLKRHPQPKVKGCGLYTGNNENSKTYIKGKTIIQGNYYIKHASKNTSVEGIGMWMQGGVVTIGETGKDDSESPIIQNHQKGNAYSVNGTAIYMEGESKVYWKSGQITNNGGSNKAIYRAGNAQFINNSGHTAS